MHKNSHHYSFSYELHLFPDRNFEKHAATAFVRVVCKWEEDGGGGGGAIKNKKRK